LGKLNRLQLIIPPKGIRNMPRKINRRTFNRQAASGALATIAGARASVVGSNDRIRLAFIGLGNRGDQLLDAFAPHKDAEIVALCDVYEPYLPPAQKKAGGRARLFHDFRKLLDQKDIDAVVIATPDHWHALQFIAACRAGKDVYVEKPVSLTIAEGRKMVEVANQTGRVTQVGLQRRSAQYIREAAEVVQRGVIGKVTVSKCYHIENEFPPGIGSPADCAPPDGLDWDFWLGPARKVPYNPNRCLYKFRWFWDYSGGQLTNFGAHYLDVIQWALAKDAPRKVFALGGKYAVNDNREIPDTMEAVWEYEGGTLVTFSQYDVNGAPGNFRQAEMEFRGTNGTLLIMDNGYEIVPEATRTQDLAAQSPLYRKENLLQSQARKPAMTAQASHGRLDTADHTRNFLDCIKSRRTTNCPILTGHRSTSATLLARIALRLGRIVHWDAEHERIVNDDEANRLLSYDYRSPWQLS
jgi:predicted dehydrogenase